MGRIVVRRYNEKDFMDVVDFLQKYYLEERQELLHQEEAEAMANKRIDNGFLLWMASKGQSNLGFAMGKPDNINYSNNLLYVDPIFRRQGIARELINSQLAHAKKTGCLFYVTLIDKDNTPSCNVHDSLGFELLPKGSYYHASLRIR